MLKKKAKTGPKYGVILGIKVSSTTKEEVLNQVRQKLDTKEKFYIVTPNPEIVLMASDDWLLKKAIAKSDFAVPDGIGLKFAYKYLLGLDLNIIKGRELFMDIIKIADDRSLKVYFVGGERGEAFKAKENLEKIYKNLKIQTNVKMPQLNRHGKPVTQEDRKLFKNMISSIKMYEPDIIFVSLGAPKQEKWIFRNFFRLNATGAMAVGGTFNYIAGFSKLPPTWMENLGLEWLWRVINEPTRMGRILKATILFPLEVFLSKNFGYKQRDYD